MLVFSTLKQGNARSVSRVLDCMENLVNEFTPFTDFHNFVHPLTLKPVSCADYFPAALGATSWLES